MKPPCSPKPKIIIHHHQPTAQPHENPGLTRHMPLEPGGVCYYMVDEGYRRLRGTCQKPRARIQLMQLSSAPPIIACRAPVRLVCSVLLRNQNLQVNLFITYPSTYSANTPYINTLKRKWTRRFCHRTGQAAARGRPTPRTRRIQIGASECILSLTLSLSLFYTLQKPESRFCYPCILL